MRLQLHRACSEGSNPPGWFVIHQAVCGFERAFIPDFTCIWISGGRHTALIPIIVMDQSLNKYNRLQQSLMAGLRVVCGSTEYLKFQ